MAQSPRERLSLLGKKQKEKSVLKEDTLFGFLALIFNTEKLTFQFFEARLERKVEAGTRVSRKEEPVKNPYKNLRGLGLQGRLQPCAEN